MLVNNSNLWFEPESAKKVDIDSNVSINKPEVNSDKYIDRLDILDSNNFITINLHMAKVFGGIEYAVYLSELISLYRFAQSTNSLSNGYIFLDRDYLKRRTTIEETRQAEIEQAFSLEKILCVNEKNKDEISLDLNLISSYLLGNRVAVGKANAAIKAVKVAQGKEARVQYLKNLIKCDNEELREALHLWVESVHERFGGRGITNALVINFKKELDAYADHNLDVALSVVNIAANRGYKEISWAINLYEKNKVASIRNTTPNTTSVVVNKNIKF